MASSRPISASISSAPAVASAPCAALERSIKQLDRVVGAEAKSVPACRLLMTVPSVGPVTALAYVATIDEAGRFAKSRALGAYLGLTSRRKQSGEMDYSGRISKQGDSMLRALLYGAANGLLTRVRRAHPLKAWARRIRKRGERLHGGYCAAWDRRSRPANQASTLPRASSSRSRNRRVRR